MLMIGVSAYLATIGMISVGSVLTSYLCFSQLIKPLEELHRILDELSESLILADDFFSITEIPNDFSYISTAAKPAKTSSGPLLILQHLTFGYQKTVLFSMIFILRLNGEHFGELQDQVAVENRL